MRCIDNMPKTIGLFLGMALSAAVAFAAPLPIGNVSGTAPSGLSWAYVASGSAMPLVVNGTSTATPGAYAKWNIRNGQLQLVPNGLNINSFSFVYTSGTATVTASTPGPLAYVGGTSGTAQVSGTSAPIDQKALPAGTWNSITTWGSRVGGTVSRTPTTTSPTLATSGYNTASTNGWLNQTWSFPSTLVTSGSAVNMLVSDWRTQGVTGNPNANVIGWGAYQGTFSYTLSGTAVPGTQVGAVVPTGLRTLEWNTTNGTWDHTLNNWNDVDTTLPSDFYNLDRVRFVNAAGGTVTVSGTESPSEFSISATSGTYTFTGGTIGGYAQLAKSGAGTAVFSSANAWSGGTALSAGTIRGGNDAAFGTGTIAASGGTIASANSSARTFSNAVTLSGNITVGDSVGTGAVTFSGNVNLGGANRTLTTVANTTLSGSVSNGGLTKAGAGMLTIGGTATLTGPTAVNAGTVKVASGATLSSSTTMNVASGATLSVEGLVRTLGGGGLTVDGTLEGAGSIQGLTTIQGIHNPGTSTAPGTQTFFGDLFYQQSGIPVPQVRWDLFANTTVNFAPAAYDQIVVKNNLTFGSTTNVEMKFNDAGSTVDWSNPFWDQNQTFILYDVSGTTSHSERLQLSSSPYFDSNGQSLSSIRGSDAHFLIQQQGNNVAIVYFATPEPSTWVMAAVGAGIAGLARFRRSFRRRG